MTVPKLSPFTAAFAHWFITEEIIRRPVQNLTVIAFSPSTYRWILFLANSWKRVNWALVQRGRKQKAFSSQDSSVRIFLILEMNRLYEEMIQIFSTQLRNALLQFCQ